MNVLNFRWLAVAALSLLAGFGADLLPRQTTPRQRRFYARLAVAAAGVTVAGLILRASLQGREATFAGGVLAAAFIGLDHRSLVVSGGITCLSSGHRSTCASVSSPPSTPSFPHAGQSSRSPSRVQPPSCVIMPTRARYTSTSSARAISRGSRALGGQRRVPPQLSLGACMKRNCFSAVR